MSRRHNLPSLFICSLSFLIVISHAAVIKPIAGPQSRVNVRADDFDWNSLQPSKELAYVPCYSGQQCTRLLVPLDYNDPTGAQAAIALLKIPAKVDPSSPLYRGPAMFNPGGPGGSGVGVALSAASSFQLLLGDDYDIIGFDPRGVGFTTPKFTPFPDNDRGVAFQRDMPPLVNQTPDALSQLMERATTLAGQAQSNAADSGSHMTSTLVARDMLQIIRAHGREKLLYWGFSYGTLIGQTFASMFPNNIERMILDGVVYPQDALSVNYLRNIFDADKVYEFFFKACSAAIPSSACATHESTPEKVEQRVAKILQNITENPITVPSSNNSPGGVVDYRVVKTAIFNALPGPFDQFVPLADALAALEKGDGSLILQVNPPAGTPSSSDSGIPHASAYDQLARTGIICSDGVPITDSESGLYNHYLALNNQSVFGDIWTENRINCDGWKLRGSERFAGPFGGNTSFPLLVIGNSLDPLTPFANAQEVVKNFAGAVLLTQDSPGHTSVSALSICTLLIVRQYIRDGILPPKGTVCPMVEKGAFGVRYVTLKPLTGILNGLLGLLGRQVDTASVDQQRLLEASVSLRKAMSHLWTD